MSYLLSTPAEELLGREKPTTHTLIVGSGYGAAMAALRLSAGDADIDPADVWVLERGKEYLPGDFPGTIGDMPGHVVATGKGVRFGERDGLFDIRVGGGVSALVGSGLGGGSLINGGIAIEPGSEALAAWPERPDGQDWSAALASSTAAVKEILGINPHPDPERLGKHRALKSVAHAMRASGAQVTEPQPVPLAITFEDGPNAVGIHQNGCVDCGNCVSGCNLGAKNTLAMNVWPLVRRRGVRLFTGARVMKLRRGERGWLVDVELTARAGDRHGSGEPATSFVIRAGRVILAAGTFGSTEILMRSRDEVPLSRRLGERFSVNGDMMAFGFRRGEVVDAVARAPSTTDPASQARKVDSPGPLTVAEIRVREADGNEVSIQDGALPFPLRRVWGELLATEHLARRFVDGQFPRRQPCGGEPLAFDRSLLSHSQLMTVMGREPTAGRLVMTDLRHAPDREAEQVLEPRWDTAPEGEPSSYFGKVERLFEVAEQGDGFDGGHYLPSPPWRLLPKGLEMLEGFGNLDRHLMTTHPLGGCAMARDASEGVVDTAGRVFDGKGGVHSDLYVMDGAIVPGPIGVNPLLTIASLAHHLTCKLAGGAAPPRQDDAALERIPDIAAEAGETPRAREPETVGGALHERLFIDEPEERTPAAEVARELRRRLGLAPHERLVIDVRAPCADLYGWLERPAQPLAGATFDLGKCSDARGQDTVCGPVTRLVRCDGQVILGGISEPPHTLALIWRMLRVSGHFLRMRGDELVQRLTTSSSRPGRSRLAEAWRFLKVSFYQARVQSTWRFMRYEFQCPAGAEPPIEFVGEKTLAYTGAHLDPLSALRVMPFSIDGSAPSPRRSPAARIDMIRFTDGAPFQADRTPDSPTTLLALGSALMFMLRGIVQTHFWSFAAPGYGGFRDRETEQWERTRPPPPSIRYRRGGALYRAHKSESPTPAPEARMRLVCYQPEHCADAPAALLIHGLAHGSRVFWTSTVDVNLVQHLLGQGFQVWMLDHRLSCNLPGDPDTELSMDRIAGKDIPWAVNTVFDAINAGLDQQARPRRKVKVFAHCIGAGAFEMAVLAGRVDPERIDCAVLHAVSPWLVASEDNRWRANLISLFRSYFDDVAYDPIPNDSPRPAEVLADRFASSFGWAPREFALHRRERFDRGHHYPRTICNRMTLFYGEEWVHQNLADETHARLDTLVGPAPIGVLKQAWYCVVKGRLTNREGSNDYVRDERLRNWTFPTLFLHGGSNKVFNPEGSRRSADELTKAQRRLGIQPRTFLKIIEGYGHMDVLFGRRAYRRVFPTISEFLHNRCLASRHERTTEQAARGLPAPACPLTGPIISNPRIENGRKYLRIWAEVSSYVTRAPDVRYRSGGQPVTDASCCSVPPRLGRYLQEADKRLADLDLTDVRAPVEVHLEYPAEMESEGAEPLEVLDWQSLPWFRRAFDTTDDHEAVSFLVGSCLYPGAPAERELSDRVFERMRPFIEGSEGSGVDHLLLVGDQIYADATANLFDPVMPLERFRERYQRAFGGPERTVGRNAHWVLGHVPCYFAIDDHEISDDWPKDLERRRHPRGERYSPRRELAFARREAWSFLMHHARKDELYYDFESAGMRFFVFDTRSERQPGHRNQVDSVIGEAQQQAFVRWLRESRGRWPLAIVTGSPLGPISSTLCRHPVLADQSDTLIGYPGFLQWLHQTVTDHGAEEILWISGDVHLSSFSSYAMSLADRPLTIHHLIASGLFAPLPFANASWSEFGSCVQFTRTIETPTGGCQRLVIEGRQHLLSEAVSHFVNVTLTPQGITAQAHHADGETGHQVSAALVGAVANGSPLRRPPDAAAPGALQN